MRYLLSILIIAVLAAALEMTGYWWMIAVAAFAVTLLMDIKPGRAFLAGFTGIALFWTICTLMHDIPNQHILSTRMAGVFKLPGYDLFIVVTVFIGALTGGLAGWCGALLRRLF